MSVIWGHSRLLEIKFEFSSLLHSKMGLWVHPKVLPWDKNFIALKSPLYAPLGPPMVRELFEKSQKPEIRIRQDSPGRIKLKYGFQASF